MGSNAESMLFFGVCLDDEGELPWGDEDDSDVWLWTKLGFDNNLEDDPYKFLKKLDIRIDIHSCWKDPGYHISIASCYIQNSWEKPEEIDPNKLSVSPLKKQQLKDQLKRLGIDKEPRWYMTSFWG